mgnify:CR=1 FL=1
MSTSPEQKVQNSIEKYLKSNNIFYEKRQAGGFNYKKGIPDLYFVFNGEHIEIEIKKPHGAPSAMQIMWQRKFAELYNIKAYIVSSVEEINDIIESLKKSS